MLWYVIKYRTSLHLYGCFVRQKCPERRSFVEIRAASVFVDLNCINIVCGAS